MGLSDRNSPQDGPWTTESPRHIDLGWLDSKEVFCCRTGAHGLAGRFLLGILPPSMRLSAATVIHQSRKPPDAGAYRKKPTTSPSPVYLECGKFWLEAITWKEGGVRF